MQCSRRPCAQGSRTHLICERQTASAADVPEEPPAAAPTHPPERDGNTWADIYCRAKPDQQERREDDSQAQGPLGNHVAHHDGPANAAQESKVVPEIATQRDGVFYSTRRDSEVLYSIGKSVLRSTSLAQTLYRSPEYGYLVI